MATRVRTAVKTRSVLTVDVRDGYCEKRTKISKIRIPCVVELQWGHEQNPHRSTTSISSGCCYGFPSRELSSILHQPSNKSIHMNVGSDNHMINFVGNELLGWLTKANEDWGENTPVTVTAHTYIHIPYRAMVMLTLSLFTPREVQLHSFLTSATHEGEILT